MRYLPLLLLAACAQPRETPPAPPPPAGIVTATASATASAAPAPPPCPTGSAVAAAANGSDAPSEGPPSYLMGAGTLRLSVAHSVEQAEDQKRKLERLVPGWKFQVWRTSSGKDAKVKARVQAADVHPAAGTTLCDWLAAKGWEPGAVPCEMR